MDRSHPWVGYAWAGAAVVACTFVGYAMRPRFDLVNVAMVYLLPVVVVALRYSRGAAIATAALSVAAFDVAFVPPEGAFTVDDVQYLLTFAIMIAIAFVISGLRDRVRREAGEQARLAAEAETERLRSTLLASISHDLRTPLAVMSGASSSLAERGERLSAEERHALSTSLYEQASELSERVAKLLDMTRLESGTLPLDRDWTSIDEIAAAVLQRLEARLAKHHVLVELPPGLPLVRADSTLLDHALANLLENAAKHTPEGTVVRLRARAEPGKLVVTVEDYGGGIPAAEVEQVFAKFHHGTSPGAGGMGLGLSICRAIVRLHGGHAWAERVPEGGTAFHIALPIEPAPAVPSEG